MLKRFGASAKKRDTTKLTMSTAIVSVGDQPETSEDDPAKALEGNKVKTCYRSIITYRAGLSPQRYRSSLDANNPLFLSAGLQCAVNKKQFYPQS